MFLKRIIRPYSSKGLFQSSTVSLDSLLQREQIVVSLGGVAGDSILISTVLILGRTSGVSIPLLYDILSNLFVDFEVFDTHKILYIESGER